MDRDQSWEPDGVRGTRTEENLSNERMAFGTNSTIHPTQLRAVSNVTLGNPLVSPGRSPPARAPADRALSSSNPTGSGQPA